MRIYILTIKQLDTTLTYRAYASTDPDRSESDTRRDLSWQLGFQPDHPGLSDVYEPHSGLRGTLQRTSAQSTSLTVSQCGDAVRVAVDTSGYVSTSYPILAEQGLPDTPLPSGYFYATIPFFAIQPNLLFVSSDSDSDSD